MPDAALARLVGHVERDDHALAHVDELQREEQVALEVDRIDDVDHDVAGQDDVARDRLLVVERRDAVDARGVDDVDVAEAPAHQLDRRAREVGDVDVGARERVEHDRLADVGLPASTTVSTPSRASVPAGGSGRARRPSWSCWLWAWGLLVRTFSFAGCEV